MCGIVLSHFGLHLHAFHLDFIHFQGIGIPLFQAFFEQLQQGIGILHPLGQQLLFLVQPNQVQTQVLGLQQNVATEHLLLTVQHVFLRFSGTGACRIQRGEIKSLRHHQFRTGHAVHIACIKRTVLHAGVFQVIPCLHFHLGRFHAMHTGLKFLVVLLHGLQHLFYFLCLQPAGKSQARKQYPSKFFHASVLLVVFFRFINSYTIGMTKAFRKVEVSNPPRMTLAIGL